MKRVLCIVLCIFAVFCRTSAQTASYTLVGAEIKSPSSVLITLKTFCEKKKTVDLEAKCAALRIIMFDGLDGTIYNKPLLAQGTIALSESAAYFDDLFFNRLSDVVKSIKMESDFKKAENGEKSTLYTVVVNYIQLKKDLEKNKIKNQLGI